MVIETIIAAVVIILVSLVGVVSTWKTFGGWMTRNLHYLISFSAGVFLIVALGLVGEVLENTSITNTLILVGFGVLSFFIFGRVALGTHEHHDPGGHTKEHKRTKREGRQVLLADALHNVTDGIILVPAFAVSVELGVVVTIGIVIHELVQEVSEFFVLRESGHTVKGALLRNFIVSMTILIGIALGFGITQVEGIELGLLGLAAGGFFYVVFSDLVPHSLKLCRDKYCTAFHLLWAFAGIVIMLGLNAISAFAS